jgi:hypothetical protein
MLIPSREACDFSSGGTRIDGNAGTLIETDPAGIAGISAGFAGGGGGTLCFSFAGIPAAVE